MTEKYDDIIHLDRPISKKYPPMKSIDRAAQFSPFAALTGHGAAVEETARQTDERIDLDQYMKDALSYKLQIIEERLRDYPEIQITYFQPDTRKSGGSYKTIRGTVRKIDYYDRLLFMTDGNIIPIDEIIQIDGKIFTPIFD